VSTAFPVVWLDNCHLFCNFFFAVENCVCVAFLRLNRLLWSVAAVAAADDVLRRAYFVLWNSYIFYCFCGIFYTSLSITFI